MRIEIAEAPTRRATRRTRAPDGLHRPARQQARRARPHPRRRGSPPPRSCSAARATRSTTLTETLNGRGYRAEALHGGMTQEQRDRVMGRLRAGNADLLVATDVAARGLDIDTLTHVVNYDVPVGARGLRAPHRPRRPRRARGRRDHARRAARAPLCCSTIEQHHQAEDRDREGPDGRRPARAPAGADARAACEESLLEDGDLDHFRVVVETLAEDYDLMDVAAAAVKLAHEAGGASVDEEEIPDASPPPQGPARRVPAKPGKRPDGEHDPHLRRRRPRRRHPPAGPRRRHRQRGRPAGPRHRRRSRSPTASRSSRCRAKPPST